jgi:hypothetical protein
MCARLRICVSEVRFLPGASLNQAISGQTSVIDRSEVGTKVGTAEGGGWDDGEVVVITESSIDQTVGTRAADWHVVQPPQTFSAERIRSADTIVLMGPLGDRTLGRQIAGSLVLSASEGAVVIYLAADAPTDRDSEVMGTLFASTRTVMGVPRNVESRFDAFDRYFTVFGMTATVLEFQPPSGPDYVVVGELVYDEGQTYPCAVRKTRGRGFVYHLPYSAAGNHAELVGMALTAVKAHLASEPDDFPAYLHELVLPGEADLIARRDDANRAVDEYAAQIAELENWKRLLGELTGAAFERLVIGALNLVLDGSGCHAEDRGETSREDFWVVRDGAELAICEAKGVATHIRREHVSQVDAHRERDGRATGDVAGLLVVNVRRSRGLDEKRQPVAADVIDGAARNNVVILRTWDLYQLVALRLAGDTQTRDDLISAFEGGGGWLEVDAEARAARLHKAA